LRRKAGIIDRPVKREEAAIDAELAPKRRIGRAGSHIDITDRAQGLAGAAGRQDFPAQTQVGSRAFEAERIAQIDVDMGVQLSSARRLLRLLWQLLARRFMQAHFRAVLLDDVDIGTQLGRRALR